MNLRIALRLDILSADFCIGAVVCVIVHALAVT